MAEVVAVIGWRETWVRSVVGRLPGGDGSGSGEVIRKYAACEAGTGEGESEESKKPGDEASIRRGVR